MGGLLSGNRGDVLVEREGTDETADKTLWRIRLSLA
jgi:hypothetical protein